MKIYVCDRCGSKIDCMIEPSEKPLAVRIKDKKYLSDKRNRGLITQLCDKCYQELNDWWYSDKK